MQLCFRQLNVCVDNVFGLQEQRETDIENLRGDRATRLSGMQLSLAIAALL
jgi:hypothetical protein